MIKNEKDLTQKGVFVIACKKCGVTSYVGFDCTDQQMEDSTHGLMGYAKRKDGAISTSDVGEWIHCPACDETLKEKLIADYITDITKPEHNK